MYGESDPFTKWPVNLDGPHFTHRATDRAVHTRLSSGGSLLSYLTIHWLFLPQCLWTHMSRQPDLPGEPFVAGSAAFTFISTSQLAVFRRFRCLVLSELIACTSHIHRATRIMAQRSIIDVQDDLIQHCLKVKENDTVGMLERTLVLKSKSDLDVGRGWKWTAVNRLQANDQKGPVFILLKKNHYVVSDKGLVCINNVADGKMFYWPGTYTQRLQLSQYVGRNMSDEIRKRRRRQSGPRLRPPAGVKTEPSSPSVKVSGGKRKTIEDADALDGAEGETALPALIKKEVDTAGAAPSGRALIIGNQGYISQDQLNNAINDAVAVRNFFEEMGYTVKVKTTTQGVDGHHDITLTTDDIPCEQRFQEVLELFASSIQNDEMVVFFFAGHAGQGPHGNVLLPLDAPCDDFQLANCRISLQYIHDLFRDKCQQRGVHPRGFMFFIDACRSFLGGVTRGQTSSKKRLKTTVSSASGSSKVEDSPGSSPDAYKAPTTWTVPTTHDIDTVYSFACAPGKTSDDGPATGPRRDRHGIYTKCLLQALRDDMSSDVTHVLRSLYRLVKTNSEDEQGEKQRT